MIEIAPTPAMLKISMPALIYKPTDLPDLSKYPADDSISIGPSPEGGSLLPAASTESIYAPAF